MSHTILMATAVVGVVSVVAILLFVLLRATVRHVPQSAVIVVERRGRFSRLLYGGFHILVPFLDKPRQLVWTGRHPGLVEIGLREQFIDLPFQPVLTMDGVTVAFDTSVYWRVSDPRKAVYGTADLTGRVIELTLIALRDAVGKILHTATSLEEIAARMQHGLDAASAGWGLAGTRVEVRSHEVIDAAATPAAALEHYLMALERAGLADGKRGVVFESLGGERLLAFNGERMLEPASLVKIATSAAAIERLAPTTAFHGLLYKPQPHRSDR